MSWTDGMKRTSIICPKCHRSYGQAVLGLGPFFCGDCRTWFTLEEGMK